MSQNINSLNHSEEREISLGSLLWKIIYSWRMICISIVVFAVVFVGAKYIKDSRASKTNLPQTEASSVKLTETESEGVTSAKQLMNQLKEKEKYQSESIIMNLNPYQKNVVTLQYYVNTGYTFKLDANAQRDNTINLVNSYISYVTENGMIKTLSSSLKWKIDDNYIAELVNASGKASTSDNILNQAATFSVYITGKDANSAKELAEAVEKVIDDYQSVLGGKIGAHQLTLLNRYDSVVSDTSLADRQNNLEVTIISLRSQLSDITEKFTPIQLQQLNGKKVAENTSTAIAPTKAVISKKFILLGALVGIFCSCLWVTLCFIMDRSIKSVQELKKNYGLRVLGDITIEKKKKHFLSGIDRKLDKLKDGNVLTLDEQENLAFSNLKMTCKKEMIQHLFFTASFQLKEQDKEALHMLMERLTSLGIQVDFGADIMSSVESFEKMSEIGNVVLVEKIGQTRYDSLDQEIVLCQEQKAQVLGVLAIR